MDRLLDSRLGRLLLLNLLSLDLGEDINLLRCGKSGRISYSETATTRLVSVLTRQGAKALESVVQLRGDHPHLVGVATGKGWQHLHVLVGQQTLVGLTSMDGIEHGRDSLGFTLGAQHLA